MDDSFNLICSRCVGDSYLSKQVADEGEEGLCSYCHKIGKRITIERLSDHFEKPFLNRFQRTPCGPSDIESMMLREGLMCIWSRSGAPLLSLMQTQAGISAPVAEGIRDELNGRYGSREEYEMELEVEFDSKAHYESRPVHGGEFTGKWLSFEDDLMLRNRHFSRQGYETLKEVFSDIEAHRTHKDDPVVVLAGPNTAIEGIYRARSFQDLDQLKAALAEPDQGIGPPPSRSSTSGRMNAHGISMFYGALQSDVALAEVRPVVGCRVVTAFFRIVRPLRLLDLEAFRSIRTEGSTFDPTYMNKLQKAQFLASLSRKMTVPVMPNDEMLEYLPTQAVADFLSTQKNPALDGIIYPSVQVSDGARNVVLFHKAALVDKIVLSPQTQTTVETDTAFEDGYGTGYRVWHEIPSKKRLSKLDKRRSNVGSGIGEDRDIALSIDMSSLRVHHIRSVAYSAEDYPVDRRSFTQNPKNRKY